MLRQNDTFPEVDTLKNVKINCSKKVKGAIVALSGELMKLDTQVVVNPREVIDAGIISINRARDKVLQIVYKYFEDLEVEYTKRINDVMQKLNSNDDVTDKIKNLVAELEHLLSNIESPSQIQTIKKILMIDIKSMLDKLKYDVGKTLDYRNTLVTNFAEVAFDEPKLYGIADSLSRSIYLHQKEDLYQDNSMFRGNISDVDIQQQNYQQQSYQQPTYQQSSYQPQPNYQPQATGLSALIKYHRSYYNDVNIRFPISQPDFFDAGCQTKYLHFFQNHENRVHYLDLEKLISTNIPVFQTIQLDVKFNIPPFHKSITTPKGDIFLIGGSDADNSKKKLRSTFIFDFKLNTLVPKANMIVPRSSFAICYVNGFIYVVGGLTNNSVFTNACEKYDIVNDRWLPIAYVKNDVLAPCIAAFNNKYIFKFGGSSLENKYDTFIEKYDPDIDTWNSIAFTLDRGLGISSDLFRVLTTSACVQINENEIYVFGGYLEDNTGSNQTFLLRVNQVNGDDKNPANYTIAGIGMKTLTHPEAFWNNTPLIFNKNVVALQNVSTPEQEDICLDDRRRVVVFNGIEWKNLN